ncbi:MAG: hypothetical protein HOO67_00650 [Candidatus Peribacteraceae bacterium]|nr:hypothetical protein [Candidatus Peribacteraceae bacterium]
MGRWDRRIGSEQQAPLSVLNRTDKEWNPSEKKHINHKGGERPDDGLSDLGRWLLQKFPQQCREAVWDVLWNYGLPPDKEAPLK